MRALGNGIVAVLEMRQMHGMDNRIGVAIVAINSCLALKAQALLKVDWGAGMVPNADSATLSQSLKETIGIDVPALTCDGKGKSASYSALSASDVVSAGSELPFLNEAPMEILNCVISWQDGKCEI